MYLFDYHLHSNNSTDGTHSILAMCEKAYKLGLKEIAFTDHFEPGPGNEDYPIYNPYKVFLEINRAKLLFNNKLKIRLGIELGQPHQFPLTSQKILDSFSYDYVLASAHKLKNGTDISELNFAKWKQDDLGQTYLDDLCETYLIELKSLIQWGDFDCIGHLDLIKRYASPYYQNRITLLEKRELLEEVLHLLIQNGKGLEINTSGLRQAPKETLPGIDVLTLYKKMGGEIITLGSDAHNVIDIGKGIMDAWELAKHAGFKYVTTFEKRNPIWISLYKGQLLKMIT